MEIHKIVNSELQSNTYILSSVGSNEIALVDVGDFDKVLSQLQSNQVITHVFLTHTHYDHIYGLPQLLKVFPECTVYTSEFGEIALKSPKYNLSRYHGNPIICEPPNLSVLFEGDRVKLFNTLVEIFETPGHDKSCLSYIINNNIFTGDSYIPDYKVFSTLPNSDKASALQSEKRLKELSLYKNLFPGHFSTHLRSD